MGGAAPWASVASAAGAAPASVDVALVRSRFADYRLPAAPVEAPHGRAAAVLLPVFEEHGEARILLTRRPETMPSHRGEIAFPGGKVEPADRDARAAALREAEEEIGLRPDSVDVIATLPTLSTFAGAFHITPFVGIVDGGRPDVHADSREVDRVFDVALVELASDVVYREEWWSRLDGTERAMQLYLFDDETIWGATARILTAFLAHLLGVEDTGTWV